MDFSKHSAGTTSVKVHHAPGGKSSFSLGWDVPVPATKNTKPVTTTVAPLKESNQTAQTTETKTSVKVHNPPGGRSNIIFGWMICLHIHLIIFTLK